jgi:hypothetical protein
LKDGYPEDWIKWVMAFRENENQMLLKESADNTRMFRTLFKVQALSYFKHHLRRRVEAEDSELLDNELIELVLKDVGLEYIPKRVIHVQKYYMRWAMLIANIDIFEISYEESVSYFKRLENLEKIRYTKGPNPTSLPVDAATNY